MIFPDASGGDSPGPISGPGAGASFDVEVPLVVTVRVPVSEDDSQAECLARAALEAIPSLKLGDGYVIEITGFIGARVKKSDS